tara:strand:+ start:343 stop:522 length:180 start_codon:yes stop_codon:yes gene_type:complete
VWLSTGSISFILVNREKERMDWEKKDRLKKTAFIGFIIAWCFAIGYFYSSCQDTPIINF